MEALFDLLNSYWNDEAILRRILVTLSAATIFILGLGLTVLIMNLANPLRRRMGLGGDAPLVKDRLMIRLPHPLHLNGSRYPVDRPCQYLIPESRE